MQVQLRKQIQTTIDESGHAAIMERKRKMPMPPFIGMAISLNGETHTIKGVTIEYDAPEPICIVWLNTDRSLMNFLPSEREAELHDTIDYYTEQGWRRVE
jgi:hypothetical protein